MKKLSLIALFAMLFWSCGMLNPEKYPGQTSANQKPVPPTYAILRSYPSGDVIGSVTYIYVAQLQGFVLFKNDTTKISEMRRWLKTAKDNVKDPPILQLTCISIDPFILFTRSELKVMPKEVQQKVVDLTHHKTYHLENIDFYHQSDLRNDEDEEKDGWTPPPNG